MGSLKTLSSISPQRDKKALKFLYKTYPELKDIPRIKNLKDDTFHINDANPNLDDIISSVEKQYKVKDLIREIPDDIENFDHEYAPPNRDRWYIKFLWKLYNFIQPTKDTDKEFELAVRFRTIMVLATKFIVIAVVRHFIKVFVNYNLEKLAVSKLDKHFNNGRLVAWFDKEIEKVYKANPDYKPLSIEEFKKTTTWQRNAAEWRDKTKKQIIKRMSHRVFTATILLLCTRIPLPFSFLYSIPARIALAYVGCRLAIGSINTMVVAHNGNSLCLGVSFTKLGFEIVNPELFVRRKSDDKIVRVELPKVPYELYDYTEKELKEIKDVDKSFEQLKKELSVVHDRN